MPQIRSACLPVVIVGLLVAACQGSSGIQSSSRDAGGSRGGPQPAPRRATPVPAPPLVVAAGTTLPLELRTGVSTVSSKPGDLVVAELREDVRANGRVALPAGSELRGRVTAAVRPGKVKGQARLAIAFDEALVRGKIYPLQASGIDVTAAPQKKHDAALIGGGVGAGALIGAATGGKKGAGIGALVGGAAGGGAVLLTRGRDLEFKAGAPLTITLERALKL